MTPILCRRVPVLEMESTRPKNKRLIGEWDARSVPSRAGRRPTTFSCARGLAPHPWQFSPYSHLAAIRRAARSAAAASVLIATRGRRALEADTNPLHSLATKRVPPAYPRTGSKGERANLSALQRRGRDHGSPAQPVQSSWTRRCRDGWQPRHRFRHRPGTCPSGCLYLDLGPRPGDIRQRGGGFDQHLEPRSKPSPAMCPRRTRSSRLRARHSSISAKLTWALPTPGFGRAADPLVASLAEFQELLDTNLNGVFLTFRELGRHMKERGKGGKLIAISSISAQSGTPMQPHYAASKGGVEALVRSYAVRMARYDVQVNAIAPGWIVTDATAPAVENEAFSSLITKRIPARRWGTPKELEGVAVYLASDASGYHTGDTLRVDGGYAIF